MHNRGYAVQSSTRPEVSELISVSCMKELMCLWLWLCSSDVALDRDVDGDLVLGDMGEGIPFRAGTFDGCVRSVSHQVLVILHWGVCVSWLWMFVLSVFQLCSGCVMQIRKHTVLQRDSTASSARSTLHWWVLSLSSDGWFSSSLNIWMFFTSMSFVVFF